MIKPTPRPRSRPISSLERRPSTETLLPTRPASLGSTSGLATYSSDDIDHLDVQEEHMETLASPSRAQDLSAASIQRYTEIDHVHRPYSSSVGWNSSTTFRRSSSTGSLSSLSLADKGLKGSWDPRGMTSRTEVFKDKDVRGDFGGVNREGGDNWRIRLRYLLMFTHASFLIAKMTHTIYLRDSIMVIVFILSSITFLIYIPAAFGLSLARKGSSFDHASGEVSYLIVQSVLWIFSAYYSFGSLAGTDCSLTWDWFEDGVYAGTANSTKQCLHQGISGGISLAHTLFMIGWAGWIGNVVIKRGKKEDFDDLGNGGEGEGGVSRCWGVSTHWLLRGWEVSGGMSGPPY